MKILDWINNWFLSHCDGDWEHTYGIKIETSDNPGWIVTIDLEDTYLELYNIDYGLVEKGEHDWYGYSIKNGIFQGVGDVNKLELLLNKFKEIVMEDEKKRNS